MKYTLSVTLFLACLFLLSQVVGLSVVLQDLEVVEAPGGEIQTVHPETAIGPRPEVDTDSGESVLFVLSGVFLGTILLLLIIRFAKVNYWKLLFFVAVITTMTITLGVFMPRVYAFIIAFFLTVLKLFRSNTVTHNVTELLIYAGIAVLFVPLFSLFWITVLLGIISAYDAFAVWHSKHMVTLARFQTGSGLFAGLSVKLSRGRYRQAGAAQGSRPRKVMAAPAEAILGGGDIAFPLIFSGVVMESLVVQGLAKEAAFLKVLTIPLVLTAVLLLLLVKGRQGRFYPAMPFLTAGCLIGLAIVSVF